MDSTLLSSKADECIHRIELEVELLRQLRFKVEVHATQLRTASGTEREFAYQLYKQSMRRLLTYLQTNFIH